jgi:Tol biopolymer transport system component
VDRSLPPVAPASPWARIKEHKVLQWSLAYLGAALALAHGQELLAHNFHWPELVGHVLIGALIVGFPIAVALAWYHGHKGLNRLSAGEMTVVSLLLVIGAGLLIALVRTPGEHEANPVASAESMTASAVVPSPAQEPLAGQVSRFEIPLPKGVVSVNGFELSPDGRKLVFRAAEVSGHSRLWLRSFDMLEARPMEGTEDESSSRYTGFWSPDSRSIGFFIGGKLKRIGVTGGPPITICDVPSFLGGSWNRADEIVVGTIGGLMKVSAAGGSPTVLTRGDFAVAPSFLPDGRRFVYLRPFAGPGKAGIYLGTLDETHERGFPNRLLAVNTPALYAPSAGRGGSGYLIFGHSNAPTPNFVGPLLAQPFDPERLKVTGDAVAIAEPVTNYSVSATGVLVYSLSDALPDIAMLNGARGVIHGQLAWFDRQGKILGRFGDPGSYRHVALSPDGTRVAFDRADPQNSTVRNLWLYDLGRGVTTRFTFDTAWDSDAIWSPDGSRIVFASNRGSGWELYQKASNLAGEDKLLLSKSKLNDGFGLLPTSWSPDGRFVLYFELATSSKQWLLPVGGSQRDAESKPEAFDAAVTDEAAGRFSPDGRWIAYSSDASGRTDIYVRPFSANEHDRAASGKWMVSNGGGISPLWRRDGKELFYVSLDGIAMSVPVDTSGVFQAGTPRPLFKVPDGVLYWDVSADGKRFLMAVPTETGPVSPPKIILVLNWQAALRK